MNVQHLELRTERLTLRPPRLADAAAIAEAVNNPTIARNTLNIPHPYTLANAQEWLGKVAGENWHESEGHRPFLITHVAENKLIGICGIGVPNAWKRSEMGYWISETHWGNGYASEAARRVLQYGFEVLGAYRIQATYITWNPASRRVMEKIGMVYEGILRGYVVKDGEPIDVGICAVLQPDWTATR